MKLKKMNLDDFEEVVDMHYSFVKEVYPNRVISPRYFFYKEVMNWINDSKDVVLAIKDETIVGYTMAYLDEFNALTEPVYNGEIAYVKPEYRKTRAGYMLYKNVYNYAQEKGLKIVTNGRVENGVSDMMNKHFSLEPKFINYEGVCNG